jgi:hypothetical protein
LDAIFPFDTVAGGLVSEKFDCFPTIAPPSLSPRKHQVCRYTLGDRVTVRPATTMGGRA